MIRRVSPRLSLAVAAAVLAGTLAGCSSAFLVDGPDAASPSASAEPTPDVTAEPSPEPVAEPGCGSILLDEPGRYVLGDCDAVEVTADDVSLVVGSVGTLTLRGDGAEVDARGPIDALLVKGNDSRILAPFGIGTVADDGLLTVIEPAPAPAEPVDN